MKRKMLRIMLCGALIAAALASGGAAYAQDGDLPDPGITPDSPLYFLDTLGKNLGLLFAFSPEAKARKALEYAAERLSEARAMAASNRSDELRQAAGDYDKFVAIVTAKAEEASQRGASDNISELVALATAKHLSVLDRVKDAAPEEAKEALARAKESSRHGQERALRALAAKQPEKAIEINLTAIEDRLNRASAKAEENDAVEVEEALSDADKLVKFGAEISGMAQGAGEDAVKIEEMLAQATASHLKVLERVRQHMPEQARPAVERAMANVESNHESLLEALREKGNTAGPREKPAPEGAAKERLVKPEAAKTEAARDAAELQEKARHAIQAAAEKLAKIQLRAREAGLDLKSDALAHSGELLSQAKAAYEAGDYQKAISLAEQSQLALREFIEKLEHEEKRLKAAANHPAEKR